jgi:hypothetical protein
MSTLYVDNLQPNLGSGVHIPGHVIQTVSNAVTSRQTSSSATFVATDVAATITPKFSNSKIIITICSTYSTEAAGRGIICTIYRGSTNVTGSSSGIVHALTDASSNSRVRGGVHISYMDNPNTTSATTYTLYFRSSNDAGAVEIPPINNVPQTIILQEIAQ